MSTNTPVLIKTTLQYRRRKPQYAPYYQCIEDYYEEFKRSYDRNFSQKYGYLRPHIEKVIYQYLDFVFSIPKILRIYFLFNRNLLKELSRISWEVIGDYYRSTCIKEGGKPAAVAVIQTFGDYLLTFPPKTNAI